MNNKEKRWVKLENTISNATVRKIIWIQAQLRELSENTHDITQKALAIWDLTHKREKWEFDSPLIPLRDTNYFPPGNGRLFEQKNDNAQLKDIMEKGKICTLQDLKQKKRLIGN